MSTTTSRTPEVRPPRRDGPGERRILLTGIGPELYEAIAASRGDDPTPRLAWLDGDLELMSPSPEHDDLAELLSDLVKMVADALGLDCRPLRTTTWRRLGLGRSKEADACFFFTGPAATLGRGQLDLKALPPPDLAIEVEISPPEVDVEQLYAGLGVPELWRHDGERLRILHLGPDGRYAAHDRSRHIPRLRVDDAMAQLAKADTLPSRAWRSEVGRWAREELADRPD
ncbi:Uma2 family endonuclease [Tautonia plasticadhaerens]|uniref:Putative restriction endonuclease domain-containing protein n=1 Tax=Tautonia plasticadhaerens TaxID=2527974 RepID=A0A518HE25_9BACT|nr:Uma2 family endonuclease [Tautonia plasticadhaerens]QDV39094.1 hypothetical protein ElP_70570 [Tautonia plasticadhaerens]